MNGNIIRYAGIRSNKLAYDHILRRTPCATTFDAHTHDMCELLLLLKGNMSYVANGQTFTLQSGDIILSPPFVIHQIRPESNDDYERYNVIYDEKCLPKGIYEKVFRNVHVFRIENSETVISLFKKIDFYCNNFDGEELIHIVKNIIEEIFYVLAISETKKEVSATNPIVKSALKYIDDNLETIKTIDEICSYLYVTKSHLHHLFKKHLNMGPKQYINNKRLLKGRRMIREGKKPTEVFASCGFTDYATFFRNYKKQFGYPPSKEDASVVKHEIYS